MTLAELTPELALRYKIPSTIRGVLIQQVLSHGKAKQKGLQPGDVIQSINNYSTTNIQRLKQQLSRKGPYAVLIFRNQRSYYLLL